MFFNFTFSLFVLDYYQKINKKSVWGDLFCFIQKKKERHVLVLTDCAQKSHSRWKSKFSFTPVLSPAAVVLGSATSGSPKHPYSIF
jgi:hypothetical protein